MKALFKVHSVDYTTPEIPLVDHRSPLEDLCHLLTRICRAEASRLASKPTDLDHDRWEDDGYIYLEADFPTSANFEADVSVHNGKVFIRMEK